MQNQSLVSCNSVQKEKVLNLEGKISAMVEATVSDPHATEATTGVLGDLGTLPPPSDRCRCNAGHGLPAVPSESGEVTVVGALDNDAPLNINNEVAFAVLRTLLPSLEEGDIAETRMLGVRRHSNQTIGSKEGANGSSSTRLSSLLVDLSDPKLIKSLIRVKRKFNYFSTSDIDPSLLSAEALSYIRRGKIFVNEFLPPNTYKRLTSLRVIARGFKYTLFEEGTILVRKWSGYRAYIVDSA